MTVSSRHGRLRFSASLKHGILTIRLKHTASRFTITVRYATLRASHQEVIAVRHKHAGRLRITVTVTNAHGKHTKLTARVKPH